MNTKTKRVPVSSRALIQRLNRHLKPEGQMVKKTRGTYGFNTLGDYYLLDVHRNFALVPNLDLEGFGRETKVLQPFETMMEAVIFKCYDPRDGTLLCQAEKVYLPPVMHMKRESKGGTSPGPNRLSIGRDLTVRCTKPLSVGRHIRLLNERGVPKLTIVKSVDAHDNQLVVLKGHFPPQFVGED